MIFYDKSANESSVNRASANPSLLIQSIDSFYRFAQRRLENPEMPRVREAYANLMCDYFMIYESSESICGMRIMAAVTESLMTSKDVTLTEYCHLIAFLVGRESRDEE